MLNLRCGYDVISIIARSSILPMTVDAIGVFLAFIRIVHCKHLALLRLITLQIKLRFDEHIGRLAVRENVGKNKEL